MNPDKLTEQRAKVAKIANWLNGEIAAQNPDIIEMLRDLEGTVVVTWQVLLNDKNISAQADPGDGRRATAIRFLRALVRAGVCG